MERRYGVRYVQEEARPISRRREIVFLYDLCKYSFLENSYWGGGEYFIEPLPLTGFDSCDTSH